MKAKIQKTKSATPKKRYGENEVKRYLGALSENFQVQVSAIAEQFLGLNKKVDMNTEMTGQILEDVTVLKEDMKEVKSDVKVLQKDMKEVKGDIKVMKGDIKTINERLSHIEQTIKEMKDEIKELKNVLKNKADIERVELLETRLYRVEERVKLFA